MHTASSKIENSAQVSSCWLKFVHTSSVNVIKLFFVKDGEEKYICPVSGFSINFKSWAREY
jgi:hypothetical protein